MTMRHVCNNRGKKYDGNVLNADDPLTNENLKENIINHISASVSFPRDEFLNLKDIIIKKIRDENTILQRMCKSLADKVTHLVENLNSLD